MKKILMMMTTMTMMIIIRIIRIIIVVIIILDNTEEVKWGSTIFDQRELKLCTDMKDGLVSVF